MTMNSWSRALIWLPLMACGVRGSGVEATETRQVSDFTGVHNTMNIDVDVVEGETQEVLVTCDDNLLELIKTTVSGGILRIAPPKGTIVRPRATCEVLVTATELQQIEGSGSGATSATGELSSLRTAEGSGSGAVVVDGSAMLSFQRGEVSGSGALTVDGIDTDAVRLENSGSGGLTASGRADEATVVDSGSGAIRARGLTSQTATIDNSGSGAIELTVSGAADVDVSGSGSVSLWGNPQVSQSTSGSGDVIIK